MFVIISSKRKCEKVSFSLFLYSTIGVISLCSLRGESFFPEYIFQKFFARKILYLRCIVINFTSIYEDGRIKLSNCPNVIHAYLISRIRRQTICCLFFVAFLARIFCSLKLIKVRNYSVLTGFPPSSKKKQDSCKELVGNVLVSALCGETTRDDKSF